ncbi:AAA family ATPase [Desulforhopalus sp. IMCC35007]|uniref:AAA family ATPase n=1 Tax=Desulforhopalus sp. IMCC35007 TaxID=2569543 RepID=UPI0010AE63C8|nr:AAA family ATPase [Desulforhopalus sp. IMCC35007]TKB07681.1 AAA family ATPase [Desulforhopalus sp. IMCC35007]
MPLDSALLATAEQWNNYPYSISTSRESFSQKLFSFMGIPEAKADANNNNITIHQILRLIYSDQSNPSSNIFNLESFDSAFKRESIGNYLLGLYDNELYDARIALIAENKILDKVVIELKAILSFIGKTPYAKDLGNIDDIKNAHTAKISELKAKIQDMQDNAVLSYVQEKNITENYAQTVVKTKEILLECESNIQSLKYEIEDSTDFIGELEDKINALDDSIKIGKIVNVIKFKICPSCYKQIEIYDDKFCHLCGTQTKQDSSGDNVNLTRMKNELSIQLNESSRLIKKKEQNLEKLIDERKQHRTLFRKNVNKVASTISSLNTTDDSQLYELYHEIGEIEEKLASLDKIAGLSDSINKLTVSRDFHQAEVNRLEDLIKIKSGQFRNREPEIKSVISQHLIDILKDDIGSEKEFHNAHTIEYDFASNSISVNGKVAFSESGTVYLNNAFHVSLLLASLEKKYVRLPRFMILDGIENGGMEDARSRNFQSIVKQKLNNSEVSCQLIIGTKSISDDLKSDDFIVGKTFTKESKSLKISQSAGPEIPKIDFRPTFSDDQKSHNS